MHQTQISVCLIFRWFNIWPVMKTAGCQARGERYSAFSVQCILRNANCDIPSPRFTPTSWLHRITLVCLPSLNQGCLCHQSIVGAPNHALHDIPCLTNTACPASSSCVRGTLTNKQPKLRPGPHQPTGTLHGAVLPYCGVLNPD